MSLIPSVPLRLIPMLDSLQSLKFEFATRRLTPSFRLQSLSMHSLCFQPARLQERLAAGYQNWRK